MDKKQAKLLCLITMDYTMRANFDKASNTEKEHKNYSMAMPTSEIMF